VLEKGSRLIIITKAASRLNVCRVPTLVEACLCASKYESGPATPGVRQIVVNGIEQILASAPTLSVLVVGDVMLDEYVIGECTRISPEAPVPVVEFRSRQAVLGGAANTAANVAALQANVTLIGAICEGDEAGQIVSERCRSAGIRFLPIHDRRQTTRKIRIIGQQQQQLLRIDYEDRSELRSETELELLDYIAREIQSANIIIVSDYAKGLITDRACQTLIASAHELGRLVIIDPRPQHATFYRGCDYLTPNWNEAQALARLIAPIDDDAVEHIGRIIASRFKCSVLLTLGERGVAFVQKDDQNYFTVAGDAREVYDVSGAGDTVVATFALAMAARCDHWVAASVANRAAGVVVGKRGTATVSVQELLDACATRDSRIGHHADVGQALPLDRDRMVSQYHASAGPKEMSPSRHNAGRQPSIDPAASRDPTYL
jgi:D-beta-D-heptose 7-phosphate kinase/D-beta-D-heptose 1-phosphate adenosyltransferase